MGRSLNKVLLMGNVGGDPEAGALPNGNMAVRFSIATSEQWKDKRTGEKQERTDWHTIKAYGKLAEIIEQYVRKGSFVYIEGRARMDRSEKNGKTSYFHYVIADQLKLLGDPKGGERTERTTQRRALQQQEMGSDDGYEAMSEGASGEAWDDDIPF